jgi:hypothetical protein
MSILPKQPLADDVVISYWMKKPRLMVDEIVPLIFGINPFALAEQNPACADRKQDIEDCYILLNHREITPVLPIGERLDFWRDALKKVDIVLPTWLEEYKTEEELKQIEKKKKSKEIASKVTPEMKEKNMKKLAEDLDDAKNFFESMRLNPFAFSRLDTYLTLDSWDWKEGLLILAGADPVYTNVDWDGYEDICGVNVYNPVIYDILFLDSSWRDADLPSSFAFGDDEDYFRGDEMVEKKVHHLKLVESKLRNIYKQWINALTPHSDRNKPSYYIEWALSKGIYIDWQDWATKEGFVNSKENNPTINNRERETMLKIIHALAKNGYSYPERNAMQSMILDFERNGNGVSESTLRKYLKEFDTL